MAPADLEKRAALREKLHALEAQIPPPTAAAWAIQNNLPNAKTFVPLDQPQRVADELADFIG